MQLPNKMGASRIIKRTTEKIITGSLSGKDSSKRNSMEWMY
jgi:hypothetical protein